MKTNDLFLVIIAGGSGTRFWPKSTSKKPKQLLAFGKQEKGQKVKTLIEQTVERFEGWVPQENRWILTTEGLKAEMESIALRATILAEPQGRNTAPCIYWAARKIAEINPQAVMMVMPSDHYIADQHAFLSVLKCAEVRARHYHELVTLGIKPSRPETGYGYLKAKERLADSGSSHELRKVEAFVEKPNLEKAKEFVGSGSYLWNGGMFVWKAQVILDAFDQFMPEMKRAWDEARGDVIQAYPSLTATSIDFGVMEKANNVVTYPLVCGWDDLGSWTSLETLAGKLNLVDQGNTVNQGDLVALDSIGNIVDTPGRVVAALGVHDLIIVEQGEVILIAQKDRAQEIRQLVEQIKQKRSDLV
jgi:mannose-1-phosphate guanylyltransferase